MENNEAPFEVEAQDEVLMIQEEARRRSRSPSPGTKYPNVNVNADEEDALLSEQSTNESPSGNGHGDGWKYEFGHLPWYKQPSIYWLLPAFFPVCLAFGGLMVPKINLILNLICNDYLSDKKLQDPNFTYLPVLFGEENPQCRVPEVQALIAKFQLYLNLVSGIFSALVAPHLGALSDRIGRKKVVIFATMGPFCAEIITILVGTKPETISVWWLLLGAFFDGMCGSFTASMAICYSYAADCTSPERRNVAFGYFHANLFTGIAVGPILAGLVIKWYGDIIIVFYVALGCHLFFLLFFAFIIPESLSEERQQSAREKHKKRMLDPDFRTWRSTIANWNLFEPLSILWPTGRGSTSAIRRNMAFLASIDTLVFGVGMGTMNIIILYAEYRFGWGTLESSEFLSAANIARVFSLLVVLPTITRMVRGPTSNRPSSHHGADMLDISLIRVSIFFDLVAYAGYSIANTGTVMIISGVIAAVGGMGSPSIQSSLTKHVPSDRIGQLLGATGLLHSLARIVAPTIFSLIYARTVFTFPQTVFVCLGSVFILAEFFSWLLRPGLALPNDYQDPHVLPADRDRRFLLHRASSAIFYGIRRVSTGQWNRDES